MEKLMVKYGIYSFVLSFFFLLAVYRPEFMQFGDLFYNITRYSGIVMMIVVVCVGLYFYQDKKDQELTEDDKDKQVN